jgi:PEP-CTERM motif-containing protein
VIDSGSFLGPNGSCCTATTGTFTIFTGENIGAGTYYVVLTTTGQSNETGWNFTSNAPIATGGLSYNGTGLTSQQSGSFAPGYSGYFNPGDNVEFSMTSDQTLATPEPGSLFLLGSGLLGVGGVIRRKVIR